MNQTISMYRIYDKLKLELPIDRFYSEIFLSEKTKGLEDVFRVQTLADLSGLADGSIKAIVLDFTLNFSEDYEEIVAKCHRVLAVGGVLFATVSSFPPSFNIEEWVTGLTPKALTYLFNKYFGTSRLEVASFGNTLAGRYLLNGKTASALIERELFYSDKLCPIVTTLSLVKS